MSFISRAKSIFVGRQQDKKQSEQPVKKSTTTKRGYDGAGKKLYDDSFGLDDVISSSSSHSSSNHCGSSHSHSDHSSSCDSSSSFD